MGLLYLLVRLEEGYLEAQLDAYTDFLTGLRNRRYLELILERELFRVAHYGRPLSLIILDLDGFKAVNDTHGHEVGDRVLKALARCLEQTRPSTGLSARGKTGWRRPNPENQAPVRPFGAPAAALATAGYFKAPLPASRPPPGPSPPRGSRAGRSGRRRWWGCRWALGGPAPQ